MTTIHVDLGDRTEDVLQYILGEVDDEALDEVQIERTLAESPGLAGEPITTAAVISLGMSAAIGVIRIVERWLETRRQEAHLNGLIRIAELAPEAVPEVTRMAEVHSGVAVSYALFKRTDG